MLLLAGAKSVSSDSDACLACRAFARVFFSKPCFSSSAYSLMPRPFQHVQEGQGTRLECICDFLYHCPGSPQGWGRNCETNALSIPTVVPRRGGWGISLIGALQNPSLQMLVAACRYFRILVTYLVKFCSTLHMTIDNRALLSMI